jgi:PAS domain-containing protein
MPERFRERHVQHRAAYLADPRPRGMGTNLTLFARRKDGGEIPVEISLSPVSGPDGPVVIAALRDVSERRKMQEAVRLGEERLRLLVESVREYAILMLDADGRVKTWSAGAERIKGYTAHEIVGRHFSVFYPPEEIAWVQSAPGSGASFYFTLPTVGVAQPGDPRPGYAT